MTLQPSRYILTGAPGSGKTSIIRSLRRRGHAVVDEAATDVIGESLAAGDAEPWLREGFTARIATLQMERMAAEVIGDVQFSDRSVLCTLALAHFLGHPVSVTLSLAVRNMTRELVFEPEVFFVRPLGFVENTPARRISYEESLRFEAVHQAVYRSHGFELIDVPPGAVDVRTDAVLASIKVAFP